MDGFQGVGDRLRGRAAFLVHQEFQVAVGDFALFVGQFQEPLVHAGDFVPVEGVAQGFQAGLQAGASAELAQHQLHVRGQADAFGLHYLVGGTVLEHAVLVDAGSVAEGVFAHDGLVGLDVHARDAADQAAGGVNLGGVHIELDVEQVPAGVQGHNDFLEGGVAGALADAVDAALDLPGAGFDGGQAVGDGQAQVVVAVDGEGYAVDAGDIPADVPEHCLEIGGDGVAHGVGDVDGAGAGLDDFLQHPVKVVGVGAGGVHRGEFHVVAVGTGAGDHIHGHGHYILAVFAQLVHLVDFRGGEEHVDAGAGGALDGVPGGVYVAGDGAGEGADDGAIYFVGDALDGLEVAGGAGGEAGFDDVHLQAGQLAGDLHLFVNGHADAGGLLAVAQGGIQEFYLSSHVSAFPSERVGLVCRHGGGGQARRRPAVGLAARPGE